MARQFILLAALLLVGAIHADSTASSSGLRDLLTDNKYEPKVIDVNAEFDDLGATHYVGRRLQSGGRNNGGTSGGSGSSTTDTTHCNTWCKLKESLGLTIFGLLLICVR